MSIERTIRKVLKETTKEVMWLRRRLETQDIKDYLNEQIDSLTNQINPCGYSTSEDYKDVIFEVAGANFINHFSDELYVKHEMSEIEEIIWGLLTKKYGNYLINQFDGRICDDEY
jgi:cobyric acid synthase